jgi:hypothetical protein
LTGGKNIAASCLLPQKKLIGALMSQTLGGCNFQWSTIPIYINAKKGLCDKPMQKRHAKKTCY